MTNDQWSQAVDLWNRGRSFGEIERILRLPRGGLDEFYNAVFDYVDANRIDDGVVKLPKDFRVPSVQN